MVSGAGGRYPATLETADEHLAHLTEMAEEFVAKQLPMLKALKVA